MLLFKHLLVFVSIYTALVLVETKDQWARDDPAFLVLLSFWLLGECCLTVC